MLASPVVGLDVVSTEHRLREGHIEARICEVYGYYSIISRREKGKIRPTRPACSRGIYFSNMAITNRFFLAKPFEFN